MSITRIIKSIYNRLTNATLYSLRGLACAVRNEQPFRYECTVFLVILCFTLFVPLLWGLGLACAWLFVMAFELVNSAVEKAFDLIDTNFRPEIKAGKDMLSAAVFIMICINFVLWCVCAAVCFS